MMEGFGYAVLVYKATAKMTRANSYYNLMVVGLMNAGDALLC